MTPHPCDHQAIGKAEWHLDCPYCEIERLHRQIEVAQKTLNYIAVLREPTSVHAAATVACRALQEMEK